MLGVHELCFEPNWTKVFSFRVHIDGEYGLFPLLTRSAPDAFVMDVLNEFV